MGSRSTGEQKISTILNMATTGMIVFEMPLKMRAGKNSMYRWQMGKENIRVRANTIAVDKWNDYMIG
jgi:hypothetical protein